MLKIYHIIQNDLLESLDGNEERRFELLLGSVEEVGLNLDNPYGSESGFKTILHLALEEDDGLPYIEALLDVRLPIDDFTVKTYP